MLWRLGLRAQRPPARSQPPLSGRPTGRSALLDIIAGKAVWRIIHLQYFCRPSEPIPGQCRPCVQDAGRVAECDAAQLAGGIRRAVTVDVPFIYGILWL